MRLRAAVAPISDKDRFESVLSNLVVKVAFSSSCRVGFGRESRCSISQLAPMVASFW